MLKHLLTVSMAVVLLPMLASCDDEPDTPADNGEQGAPAEVLPGTIDDAMIPLDQLRSQAPPAEPMEMEEAEEGQASDNRAAPSEPDSETQPDEEPAE